ncbi:hypothetical protein U1701_00670 [Sphingomonas sp. PB2P19]|uniref:tetratricopeptide repeat protein n=1 Tax=Sphingomonas rhamnosi TaxID=3096156 RepID=UPI002FC8011F
MFGPLLIVLAQAATPSSTVPSDIIVVGRRAEQELAACFSRNCPPAEEIEASLQASVEQFADGRYGDARQTLQKAIRRNRDHAAELPGPVSSLYATLATVAEHLGDTELWFWSARNDVVVLRRNLGETHKATLTEELAFADNLFGLNRTDSADEIYRKVQRVATDHGETDLAAGAAFRRAWLYALAGRDKDAEQGADEAVALTGGHNPTMLELRDLIRARIAIRRGNDGAVDLLAARLRQSATETPKLLFAPSIEEIDRPRSGFQQDPWHDSDVRFADVGFWIRPDGRTAGAELLRDSGLSQWAPGILKQVRQRRYIPLDVEPDKPGIYRIDRFTVRGTLGMPTGSRIGRRMGEVSIHVIDLTETDAMSAAHRDRTQKALSKPGA